MINIIQNNEGNHGFQALKYPDDIDPNSALKQTEKIISQDNPITSERFREALFIKANRLSNSSLPYKNKNLQTIVYNYIMKSKRIQIKC